MSRINLREPDVILVWERLSPAFSLEESRGPVDSYFEWLWLNLEQAPRGGIRLTIERNGSVQSLQVPEGNWDATVRPALEGDLLRSYVSARQLMASSQTQEAARILTEAIDRSAHRNQSEISYWLALQLSHLWASQGEPAKARQAQESALARVRGDLQEGLAWLALGDLYREQEDFQEALGAYQRAKILSERFSKTSLLIAECTYKIATVFRLRGEIDRSELYSLEALKIQDDLAPNSVPVARTLDNLAIVSREKGDYAAARQSGERALNILERLAPESAELSRSLNTLGTALVFAGDLEAAEPLLNRSVAMRRKHEPGTLELAASLNSLALLANQRGDQELSERLQAEALAALRQSAPESTQIATVLNNLGVQAQRKGNLEQALEWYKEALAIQDRSAPDSLATARTLSNLGATLQDVGDFAGAAASLNRAYLITRKASPRSTTSARTLHNLGLLSYRQGDLELARDYYQRALSLFQELDPESREVVTILNNLGAAASVSLDLDWAEHHYRQGLERARRIDPKGELVAGLLLNLGTLAYNRKEIELAEQYYLQAFEIFQVTQPNGFHLADTLHNLGNTASAKGDLRKAESDYKRALDIISSLAPDSLETASELHSLGILAREKGDLDQALAYHRQALGVVERLAPGSWKESLSLAAIAGIFYRQGNRRESIAHLYRALEALERQIVRLGEHQSVKLEYRAKYKTFYSNLIELLVQDNRPAEAFAVLERSRARELLEMLARRDLAIEEIPSELAAEKRRLEAAYDRAQQGVFAGRGNEQSRQVLSMEIQKIQRDYEELAARIRRASPKYAALRFPQPVDLEEARRGMDPGTVMLAYDVSGEQTALFVVKAQGLVRATLLNVGRDRLAADIELFRSLIEATRNASGANPARLEALQDLGRRLYRDLVEPAAEAVESSERILILPDGPLHLLPFGALVRSPKAMAGTEGSRPSYLAAWKPVHTVLSSTLYSELRGTRPAQTSGAEQILVAFGDPFFPSGPARAGLQEDVRVRSALERGFSFESLPATRSEAQRIAAIFAGRAIAYLDTEASEQKAKSLHRATRYIHFASHATLDERFPLSSAIVLTIPEQFREGDENGLLQTWEIFEQVRLDADLVVLSACESGLGKEMGGEGLVGLTRAFQYAGARSVMASLWKISDRTTAELMVRFYRRLKEGLPKDEALRRTQMELIRGPIEVTNEKGDRVELDATAPYYWAAFQIYGDWQ